MVKKIAFSIIIAFVAGWGLLHSGFPPTHDGEYHVIRFYEFNKTLSEGNLYPRWAPDLNKGYGVPLFNYVYPFPNYASSFLHFLNIEFVDSFKISLFIALALGSISFFLWTREFWGDLGGIVASSFYTFSPYHLLDIYIRGSVGEVWALAFFPFFLWSITKFIRKNDVKFFLPSIFSFALVILSHNILSLMFFIFSFFYVLFLIFQSHKENKEKYIFDFVFIAALSLGLSAIFWLPALFEKSFVRGLEVYDYSSNFPEFYQLIFPSWGSGFVGEGLQNQLSFQIGLANLLVVLLSLFAISKNKFLNKTYIYFFLMSFLIVIFLMLQISIFVWRNVPLMNYFQFPWRFLSLEILFCSFLSGGAIFLWKKRPLGLFLIFISVSLGLGYANFAYYNNRNDKYYTSRSNFIDGTNSPGNAFNTVWAGDLKKSKSKIIFKSGTISIISLGSQDYKFRSYSANGGKILINTAFFPGWKAYVDGQQENINLEKQGNFGINVTPGNHLIEVSFEDTFIRRIASFITLISLISVLLKSLSFAKIYKLVPLKGKQIKR